MTDVLKMSRKALTVGIVLSTILWSMMASVLVAPLKASAAGCTSGSLIKGSLAAVYYCGADGKRYVFTNDKNYFTWYADFSGVQIISDADLATIQIGGNVTYRPGVMMIKIQTDPKVYAVAHGGVLRHVPSEACAVTLYGTNWNHGFVQDVSDAFFTNYTVGTPINAACTDYNKTAEMSSSQTINQDKGLSTGGVSGTASVSLASDNPAGATLPKGAMGVNFLKFNLANSGSAMVVDSITLRRVGPGSTSDIAAVYLYEGNTRLTTGRSINSSTNEVTFTGLNLSLAAGQTRSLWAAVDIATSAIAGNVHAMEMNRAMSGTTQLSGSPFTGNNFTIAGATVGQLTIEKTGAMTNPRAGAMEAKVAEFTIAANSVEDIRLKRVTLFQGGSLSGANLTNLKLKQAGLTVATAASLDANLRATFVLSEPGLLLEKGATKTFQVYADIGGGARSGDSIKLYTEESSDVYGVGQTFGYGATVVRTAYDGSPCDPVAHTGDCSGSVVEAGQLTLNFLGPSSKDIAEDGNDMEVFRFSAVAQSNIEVRHLRMQIDATELLNPGTSPVYTDIKVVNVANGSTWWGPKDVTEDDDSEDLDFNDVQTLQAGVLYTFSVTLDVEDGAADGDTVTMTLENFESGDLRNLDNSTFLDPTTDVVPSGDMVGNPMTTREASLTLTLASTPVSQTYIKGTSGVDFLGLNLKAGDAAAVTVTSLTAKGWIDTNGNNDALTQGSDTTVNAVTVADDITVCRLMDGATMLGTAESPTASPSEGNGGLLEFNGFNLTVAASQTKGLKINCDISNSAFRNGDAESVAFSLDSADLTAQDADGNSVAKSGTANVVATPPGAASVAHTIQNTGTMTYAVAPDDTESEAGLVVANTTAVLGKIRLTAQNEELKQTKIRIQLMNASQSGILSMSLFDGATLVAGPAPLSGTSTDFSGMNFVVPKDGSKTLTVKATLNSISGGAVSGADLKIAVDLTNPAAGTFEYRGTSSSTVVTTINATDYVGRSKILRKTKPTVSNAALPTSTLANGTMVLARMTITADAAEQVAVKKITWTIAKTTNVGLANTAGQSAVREFGQGSHITGSASSSATCAAGTTCSVESIFATEQTIAAGTSKTYELVLTVSGVTGGESVSTNVANDTTLVTGELASVNADGDGIDDLDASPDATAKYNFQWSDNSAIPHNDVSGATDDGEDAAASNDWTNGLYVKVLPTDTQTVTAPS